VADRVGLLDGRQAELRVQARGIPGLDGAAPGALSSATGSTESAMQMQNKRQLALGDVLPAVLSLLAYYTLFWTDFKLFGKTYQSVVCSPKPTAAAG
jgi:hypothetical protein